MFDKGDKVVLVKMKELDGEHRLSEHSVKLYGIYEVEEQNEFYNSNDELKTLLELKGIGGAFYGDRFISLVKFRKQKIKKLLSKYDQKGNTGTV